MFCVAHTSKGLQRVPVVRGHGLHVQGVQALLQPLHGRGLAELVVRRAWISGEPVNLAGLGFTGGDGHALPPFDMVVSRGTSTTPTVFGLMVFSKARSNVYASS